MLKTIGIRREDKNEWERRVPLCVGGGSTLLLNFLFFVTEKATASPPELF
jgi:hypothetical protein